MAANLQSWWNLALETPWNAKVVHLEVLWCEWPKPMCHSCSMSTLTCYSSTNHKKIPPRAKLAVLFCPSVGLSFTLRLTQPVDGPVPLRRLYLRRSPTSSSWRMRAPVESLEDSSLGKGPSWNQTGALDIDLQKQRRTHDVMGFCQIKSSMVHPCCKHRRPNAASS